jgi:mannose-1-phosphate guanylyltransferase/phosphomannomutase
MYRLSPRQTDSLGTDLEAIEAVLLAGVHSWGGCPLERVICRPLMPLADKPLIAHSLTWLRDSGLDAANICANSDTQALWNKLGNGADWNIGLHYYEDIMPRGPAGCVRDALAHSDAKTFVVVEGTLVPQLELPHLLAAHKRSGAALTMTVRDMPASIPGAAGEWTPVGIYVLDRTVLKYVPDSGYQDIKEALIPHLHEAGLPVVIYPVDRQSSPRVSGVPSYLAVSKWAVERLVRMPEIPPGYARTGEACIHETAVVDPSAQLFGPVLVGPDSVIEADTVVAGSTVIGEHCQIRSGAAVSRSVIWNNCIVGPGAVLDHSILTDNASIATRTTARNVVCVQTKQEAASRKLELSSKAGDWRRYKRETGTGVRPGSIASQLPQHGARGPEAGNGHRLSPTAKVR